MESHLMGLTVDFSMGFVCFDAASKVGVRRSFIVARDVRKETRPCRRPDCAQRAPPVFSCLSHPPDSNVSLLPACSQLWPFFPRLWEPRCASSTAQQCVNEQDTRTSAILFSKILALFPAVWTNNVTQGCRERCQSIVYRDHNPYVCRYCRQYAGWDYCVNQELLLASFGTALELVSIWISANMMTSLAVIGRIRSRWDSPLRPF